MNVNLNLSLKYPYFDFNFVGMESYFFKMNEYLEIFRASFFLFCKYYNLLINPKQKNIYIDSPRNTTSQKVIIFEDSLH
jgi:hypothetical protein